MMASFFTLHSDSGVSLHIDPESPRSLRDLKDEVAAEKAIQASLYVYDCSDAVMKAFCDYWSPSTNSPLTSAYHLLALSSADSLVLITDWINSWSESPRRYVGPQVTGVGRGKTSSLVGFRTVPPHREWDS
ncbi:hypothetical protein LIER_33122 [Lithospermum erythrorhizon]|uniref:Uncharacterized protein n=1 Tax=Lithospermum erythrorhizon TaxID=34254 RepID=A0AAV3RY14_LITER